MNLKKQQDSSALLQELLLSMLIVSMFITSLIYFV